MKTGLSFALLCLLGVGIAVPAHAYDYEEYPSIKLRSLDKITARTLTFDAQVGSTIKFGDIFIKIQSCRKPPPVEKNEAAAFLQIWQVDKTNNESHWIFSGWMFSSSPALSGMDHPVYDVWVIDCLGKDPEKAPEPTQNQALPDEGTVPEGSAPQPTIAPEDQKPVPTDTDVTGMTTPAPETETTTESPAPETAPASPQEPAPEPEPEQKSGSESIEGIY